MTQRHQRHPEKGPATDGTGGEGQEEGEASVRGKLVLTLFPFLLVFFFLLLDWWFRGRS